MRDDKGAVSLEYGILASGIAGAIVLGVYLFGGDVASLFGLVQFP